MKVISRLREMSNFYMRNNDLNSFSNEKIRKTIEYSISKNYNQNFDQTVLRCTIATMAEQKVAEITAGIVADYIIDYSDPLSFAYDVLSGPQYHGARIEVKTHQTNSRWISVNVERENPNGIMNLHHFLEYEAADVIVIYRSNYNVGGGYMFQSAFIGTRSDIKRVITRSNYSGWYLNI